MANDLRELAGKGLDPDARRDLSRGYVIARAMFTVPAGTSEERVLFAADKYIRRAGAAWESQGFQVLRVSLPMRDTSTTGQHMESEEPDRKRYIIFGMLWRYPVEYHMDVEDALVPEMVKLGLKLNE